MKAVFKMTDFSELQSIYVSILKEVNALWPSNFSAECERCTDICCRPHMTDEIDEKPWLTALAVAEIPQWGLLSRKSSKCVALGDAGCRLNWAKPPLCFSFYCEKLLDSAGSPGELVANQFLSNIPVDVCRITAKKNLLDIDRDNVSKYEKAIRDALCRGQDNVQIVLDFKAANEETRKNLSLLMLARMPRLLTKSVAKKLQKLINKN